MRCKFWVRSDDIVLLFAFVNLAWQSPVKLGPSSCYISSNDQRIAFVLYNLDLKEPSSPWDDSQPPVILYKCLRSQCQNEGAIFPRDGRLFIADNSRHKVNWSTIRSWLENEWKAIQTIKSRLSPGLGGDWLSTSSVNVFFWSLWHSFCFPYLPSFLTYIA